jgi:predicted outer membrane lipoprotein
VPLFFYLLQWYTAHIISVLLHFAFGKPVAWLFKSPLDFSTPTGVGFNLVTVYVAWIIGVLLLYPLCKWFAGVKQRRKDWWLSYL